MEGLPDTAEPKLTLQLSSPVEEAILTEVNGAVSFSGVETGQATLSVTAVVDADVPLGSSQTAYDVATFTHELIDVLQPLAFYETELVVPITANTTTTTDAPTTTDAVVLCTVTLKLTYTPSIKDQREELYELIEKISKQKAAAREDLRKASLDLHQLQLTTTTPGNSSKPTQKPAVQAGFLNKKSVAITQPQAPPPAWKIWYERGTFYWPLAKNYLLFLGFVAFSHFKGQNLAIPAPV